MRWPSMCMLRLVTEGYQAASRCWLLPLSCDCPVLAVAGTRVERMANAVFCRCPRHSASENWLMLREAGCTWVMRFPIRMRDDDVLIRQHVFRLGHSPIDPYAFVLFTPHKLAILTHGLSRPGRKKVSRLALIQAIPQAPPHAGMTTSNSDPPGVAAIPSVRWEAFQDGAGPRSDVGRRLPASSWPNVDRW